MIAAFIILCIVVLSFGFFCAGRDLTEIVISFIDKQYNLSMAITRLIKLVEKETEFKANNNVTITTNDGYVITVIYQGVSHEQDN